jgi:hypothetical protein
VAYDLVAADIDDANHRPRSDTLGGILNQLALVKCPRADSDLFGTGLQQINLVIDGAHATANDDRAEEFAGELVDRVS